MHQFDGYQIDTFEFMGREATVVIPKEADERRSWAYKMEYWGSFIETEIALLERGYHIAFVRNKTRFASPDDMEIKEKFAQFLIERYHLNQKCVPIGMSLGGAQAVIFTGTYPELVEGMYLDAPVLNFCMYWDDCRNDVWEHEVQVAYPGMKKYQLLNFSRHPVNQMDVLLAHQIPVIMLWGNEDQTVLYQNNGRLLEQAYQTCPQLLKVIVRENQGHHPHGLGEDSYLIADYIVGNMQKK